MEMLVSGPLKALGWFLVFVGGVGALSADQKLGWIASVAVGGVLVWAGRLVSAAREARVQQKWARDYDSVDQIRGQND